MAIRVLPSGLAALIAAGEVVERPASVVKELIENALDAGATKIEVSARGAALGTISVSDNGSGMPPQDLQLALERHSTSKLDHGSLSRISTLGFRGEALPSIGAVASVRIASRPADQDVAFGVDQSFGGPISKARPCAGTYGTRVDIDGLFDNHPARLKFQKSPKTERAWLRQVVDQAALSHPEVEFRLDVTGTPSVVYRSRTLQGRVSDVRGSPLSTDGILVTGHAGGVVVEGVATMPTSLAKPGSKVLDFFVNGRSVSNRPLSNAVQQAYRELTGTEDIPHAVVSIRLDPALTDVNIHPRKAEIRFFDEAAVCSAVTAAVSEALAGAGLRSPKAISGLARTLAARNDVVVTDPRRLPLGRYLGQANGSYLLAETMDGIVVIDQHAAHERVILERLKRSSADLDETVVRPPNGISVPADDFEVAAVDDFADVFSTMGFTVRARDRQITLLTYPSVLSGCLPADLVRMLIDNAGRGTASGMLRESMWETLATAACKAAIKAGHVLTPESADALLREIEDTPSAAQCNHGRPTIAFLGLADLGKLFERS